MEHEALMGQLLHEGKIWTQAFPLGIPFAANARRFREIEDDIRRIDETPGAGNLHNLFAMHELRINSKMIPCVMSEPADGELFELVKQRRSTKGYPNLFHPRASAPLILYSHDVNQKQVHR